MLTVKLARRAAAAVLLLLAVLVGPASVAQLRPEQATRLPSLDERVMIPAAKEQLTEINEAEVRLDRMARDARSLRRFVRASCIERMRDEVKKQLQLADELLEQMKRRLPEVTRGVRAARVQVSRNYVVLQGARGEVVRLEAEAESCGNLPGPDNGTQVVYEGPRPDMPTPEIKSRPPLVPNPAPLASPFREP